MSQRKYADMRASEPEKPKVDEDSIERLMQRIGQTRDGALMLAWMHEQIAAPSVPASSDNALREAEGRRRAFHDLIQRAV